MLLDLAILFAWSASLMQSAFHPHHFYMHFFVHGDGPLPLRTTLIGLTCVVAVIMLISALTWIYETWHFGWEAYRPWRIAAGLWSVFGLAAAAWLTSEAWRIPDKETLAARAAAQAVSGDGLVMRVALLYGAPEGERACERLLRHDDPSVRFEASVFLYLHGGSGSPEKEKEDLRENANWLRRQVFTGAGTSDISLETLRRFWRGFDRFRGRGLERAPRDFSQEDPFWEAWAGFEREYLLD